MLEQANLMLEQASLMLPQANLMLPQASLMLHKRIRCLASLTSQFDACHKSQESKCPAGSCHRAFDADNVTLPGRGAAGAHAYHAISWCASNSQSPASRWEASSWRLATTLSASPRTLVQAAHGLQRRKRRPRRPRCKHVRQPTVLRCLGALLQVRPSCKAHNRTGATITRASSQAPHDGKGY